MPESRESDEVLFTREAAERLGISVQTVVAHLQKGTLEGFKDGNHWRVWASSLPNYESAREQSKQKARAWAGTVNEQPEERVTVEDAARQLGVSPDTIFRALRRGDLNGEKILQGTPPRWHWFVDADSFESYRASARRHQGGSQEPTVIRLPDATAPPSEPFAEYDPDERFSILEVAAICERSTAFVEKAIDQGDLETPITGARLNDFLRRRRERANAWKAGGETWSTYLRDEELRKERERLERLRESRRLRQVQREEVLSVA